MLFLTHVLFGLLVGLLAKGFLSGGNFYLFLFLVLIGAMLPDIDEESSRISRWLGILGKGVSFFSKHRGFFHSLFFVILATVLLKWGAGRYYAWGLFLGLVSHLMIDGMTRRGVSFFYPFSDLKLKGWVKTGGAGEIIVQAVLAGLIVWKVTG